jgi:hypothetical protein
MLDVRRDPGKPKSETAVKALRKCLGCGTMFASQWSGNRRCAGCRKVLSNGSGVLGEDMIQNERMPQAGRFG